MEILGVVTDLFFQARIAAAARAAGRTVRFVARPAAGHRPDLALIDLDASTDVEAAIRTLAAAGVPVVAFGPHLDTEKRKAARAAGARRVLAKSKFVTELPRIMQDTGPDTSRQAELDRHLADLRMYGERMVQLGQIFQDPQQVSRVYFAPAAHMEDAPHEPITLDSADYLPFLAVETVRSKIRRVRALQGDTEWFPESPAE